MNGRRFIRSFGFAFAGIVQVFTEQNFRIHVLAAAVVIVAGVLTPISIVEWMILIIVIALVLGAEMLNSAIERVVDIAMPDIHPIAKQAKDIAAGAVLVFAIASVIIGLLIFLPKWF